MQLNGFEDLEKLVASTGIVSFMELVDDILSLSDVQDNLPIRLYE